MSNSHTPTIEDRLRQLLNTEGEPQPKFKLWDDVGQGRIVGFRFASVAFSFYNSSLPGWWYTVEADNEHIELHEDDIESAD